MADSSAHRILRAWMELEAALRAALPFCSVAPPTQPSELLSALRINHRIGAEEEARIMVLREVRNRAAHHPAEPPEEEAVGFEEAVKALKEHLAGNPPSPC